MARVALNEVPTSRIEWVDGIPEVVSPADRFLEAMTPERTYYDQMVLALRGLRHDPGCIDALRLLAVNQLDNKDRLRLLQIAVKAGDALWGPVAAEYVDRTQLWVWAATRPWMMAIAELGEAHLEADNTQAAKWCYERLLRLDPQDHQNIRGALEHLRDNVEILEMSFR